MTRVKIKSRDSKDPTAKTELLGILSSNDIFVNKTIPVSDGFVVITTSVNDQEKLFQGVTLNALEANGFYPQMPPELNAKRSVLLFNVDHHIYKNEEEEMKAEIESLNDWTSNQIVKIIKFQNSRTIKITFTQAKYAKKTIEMGLKCFSMSIPPHMIKAEHSTISKSA